MPRRTAWMGLTVFLPLFTLLMFAAGCEQKNKLKMQTVSNTGSGAAEEEPVVPPTPAEKTEAMNRVDKAIAAHGGPVRLRKLNTQVQKLKGGVDYPNAGLVPAEQELKMQFPDRLRLMVKWFLAEPQTNLLAVNAGEGWLSIQGTVVEMTRTQFDDVHEELLFRRILSLLPLKDPEFVVQPVEGEKVAGRPTVGVRVGVKNHLSVNLYFDAESNLLVRSYGRFREATIPMQREVLYTNHKTIDGIVVPTHLTDSRNGRVWIDCDIEYQFPAKELDPKEFARP